VVICARNEEERLADCLEAVLALNADEIVVVDGGSTDGTVAIAEAYGVAVVRSGGRGLAFDRQLGIDRTRGDLIAMIDADHRPAPDLIGRLWGEMQKYDFAVVQAGVAIVPNSFWTRAESEAMESFHHRPGPRKTIGTAPALYDRTLFEQIRFDTTDPDVSDDTDLCLRMTRIEGLKFGIGDCTVDQLHFPLFRDYVKKFSWYGQRDAAFCRKHPDRFGNMLFHLLVRYPVFRPAQAVLSGRFLAPAWFWLAATVRLASLLRARMLPAATT
tara:strand:- start:854 stop:1666 length:813 start_codon:yes stop_codon:yes gene_type:complete